MLRPRPRIRRARGGRFELRLPAEERTILKSLPGQLLALLEEGDSSLARLFPPAYVDDPERDSDFHHLMHDDLLAHRRACAELLAATAERAELSADELAGWLGALNDLRLVLGTRLDVGEDLAELPHDHPDAGAVALYQYLGWLQEQVVAALDPEY